jgi:hypothetical protein
MTGRNAPCPCGSGKSIKMLFTESGAARVRVLEAKMRTELPETDTPSHDYELVTKMLPEEPDN